MNPRSDPPRRPAGMAEDGRARPGLAARGLRCALGVTLAAVVFLAGVVCSTSMAEEDRSETAAGDGQRATAAEANGILPRIDALVSALEARIEEIRAQAEQMLDHADVAADSAGQMRFEEMYGKLVTAAEALERERAHLRLMRDELTAASGGQRP